MSTINEHGQAVKGDALVIQPVASSFDEGDPHGFGKGHHHGHIIMSATTLRMVLVVLLVFTVATVAAAQFEMWAQSFFDIVLPRWVNVAVALSIATVKSALVLLYFMQLRYDNPINTIVFLFTLFAFALFLGFTVLDLGHRDTIYSYKAGEVTPGGLGLNRRTGERNEAGEVVTETVTGSIVAFARQKYLERLATELGDMELAREEFARREAIFRHSHGADGHGPSVSDNNHSRARTGLTPDLYDAAPAGHGDGHGAAGH
ncbi:MAG: hypothetical protein AMXMBFR58_25300 [Phycisphaerae bacterium]|nr:hypothetical protein [Phycisphaerales bacterium]